MKRLRINWRFAAGTVAVLAGIALALWIWAIGWAPGRDQYPVQGAVIGAAQGEVNFPTIKAMETGFVYLRATGGSETRDARFSRNFDAARTAGLRIGALHRFNLCRLASDQAANFVTTVPRDADLLPPVIELELDEGECPRRPAAAPVQSELMTFINQIEAHAGKPAVLKLSADFEGEYQVAALIGRNLWLTGDYFPPDYGSRPWVMWSSNSRYHLQGIDGPVEWVVVKR